MPQRLIRRLSPNRREFLAGAVATPAVLTGLARSQSPIEARYGDSSAPIPEAHFPNRLHLFVWRNWELANADRMARVAGANSGQIVRLGESMGLPSKPILTGDQLRRIYISVIRQNWHVLSEQQLIALLGWDREHSIREEFAKPFTRCSCGWSGVKVRSCPRGRSEGSGDWMQATCTPTLPSTEIP